jgi:hypothetical protein
MVVQCLAVRRRTLAYVQYNAPSDLAATRIETLAQAQLLCVRPDKLEQRPRTRVVIRGGLAEDVEVVALLDLKCFDGHIFVLERTAKLPGAEIAEWEIVVCPDIGAQKSFAMRALIC